MGTYTLDIKDQKKHDCRDKHYNRNNVNGKQVVTDDVTDEEWLNKHYFVVNFEKSLFMLVMLVVVLLILLIFLLL